MRPEKNSKISSDGGDEENAGEEAPQFLPREGLSRLSEIFASIEDMGDWKLSESVLLISSRPLVGLTVTDHHIVRIICRFFLQNFQNFPKRTKKRTIWRL